MNQSKFSLADVISLLAIIVFSFVCFLGANFYTLGDTISSILKALLVFALLSGTIFGSRFFKITSRNFKANFIGEVILILLFTSFTALFFYDSFSHYFGVSHRKTEIKASLNKSIKQAENIFVEYEDYANNRINMYESRLNSVVISKNIDPQSYANYGFQNNGVSDKTQIENKKFEIIADLFPTNYSDPTNNSGIKELATSWISSSKSKVAIWKPIGIVGVVNQLDDNANEWLNKLIKLSSKRERGEQTEDFVYQLYFENVKGDFNKSYAPNFLTVLLAIFAYGLMILTYIVTKRHPRHPGMKNIFGLKESPDNVL